MLKQTLPRRLIRLRELYGLSQNALARSAGIAVSTLNEIESGLAPDVRLSTILKLCRVLKVSPDYLLGFDRDEEHVRRLTETRHRLDSYAPSPLVLADQAAGIQRKCMVCDHLLIQHEPHTQGECILMMHEKGRSLDYIAVFYGFTVSSIDKILNDEYDVRRLRRYSRTA